MEPSVVALVLSSAVLHPLWMAAIKRGGGPGSSFLGLMVVIALLGFVTALVTGADLMAVGRVWHFILISTFGLVLYCTTQALTLRRGDPSTYYPIVRSSPLFIVVVGVLFLGHGYSASMLAGIAMVLVGAFLPQVRPGTRLLDDPKTLVLALLAMSGTGIYSISDALAMREVEPPVRLFWLIFPFVPAYVAVMRMIGGPAMGWRALFAWVRNPWGTAGADCC
jgi:drug/metabolite transporter (DMT)-like permease